MTDLQQFQDGQEGDDQFDPGPAGPEKAFDGHRPLIPPQGKGDAAHTFFDAVDFLLYPDLYGLRLRQGLAEFMESLVEGLCVDVAGKRAS